MTCHLNIAGEAGKRRKAIQPSNSGRADRGNRLLFSTGQRLKAFMLEQGDDAGHCSMGCQRRIFERPRPRIA
jgi:hypothetical protein